MLHVARSLGIAFFSSPPSSKCFICLVFLNHRHICISNTRNPLLGFPHQLPALNIKYVGPHIYACHLRGCLNSSYQWESGSLGFICFLYRITKRFRGVLCRQKNTFKSMKTTSKTALSCLFKEGACKQQTAGGILHPTTAAGKQQRVAEGDRLTQENEGKKVSPALRGSQGYFSTSPPGMGGGWS